MDTLVFVARSWSYPPELTVKTRGFISQGYDRSGRAYQLIRKEPAANGRLELTLAATDDSPVFNPAFVVTGWSPAALVLVLNGNTVEEGSDFRIGRRHALESEDVVIWLKAESAKPVSIVFAPR